MLHHSLKRRRRDVVQESGIAGSVEFVPPEPLHGCAVRQVGGRQPGRRLAGRVFILLATYNGAAYLRAQLESLLQQTHENWILYWRDDGSDDGTVATLTEFAAAIGDGRCVRVREPAGRVWPAASFMALLRAAIPAMGAADSVAFVDQDDVWLPGKLTRGSARPGSGR
jgi:Glycosyl transferase family 2